MLTLAAYKIPAREIAAARLLDYLSPGERAHCEKIRNDESRQQWIGGRLAAKHLLLSELGNCTATGGRRGLRWIDFARIEEFSDWAYREIEILRPQSQQGGPPVVTWAGKPYPARVSVSHTGRLAAASVHPLEAAGVDIEIPRPRRAAFYRVNFTASERQWADRVSTAARVDHDWPYTILWCLKESVLKSRASAQLNLWRLPAIEVQPQFDFELLIAGLRASSVSDSLLFGRVGIRDGLQTQTGEAMVAITRDAVLTAFKLTVKDEGRERQEI